MNHALPRRRRGDLASPGPDRGDVARTGRVGPAGWLVRIVLTVLCSPIAALAADPKVFQWTGQTTSSWELARRYRVVDADGRRPDWGRHFMTEIPARRAARSRAMRPGLSITT